MNMMQSLRAWWVSSVAEPDEPIPHELQPPVEWEFNLKRLKREPASVTIWDVLHAYEELFILNELDISVSSTTYGFIFLRLIHAWKRYNSTPTERELFNRVILARQRNRAWRLRRAIRRGDMQRALHAAEDVPSGR